MKSGCFLITFLLIAVPCGLAGTTAQPAVDKSGYNLFNPLPDNLLGDMGTDRPNKTNSPHTLEAGHFQLETGLFSHTRTTAAGTRTENNSWLDSTLRIGLTQRTEFDIELPVYQNNRSTDLASHAVDRSSGTGDLTLMLVTNLWGNDTGDTAGGLEFWAKVPTANHNIGNGKLEGGAAFLLDVKLPHDFDLGINNGLGISANDDGDAYHADIINSICVSHALFGSLSGYVEFFSSVPTRNGGGWVGTVDVGAMLMLGKNCQLDAGINMGVTPGADDWQPFVGLSFRF